MSGTSKPAASPALEKAYQHLSNIVLGSSSESSSLKIVTNVYRCQTRENPRAYLLVVIDSDSGVALQNFWLGLSAWLIGRHFNR